MILLEDWMKMEILQQQSSNLVVPENAKDSIDESAVFKVLDCGDGYRCPYTGEYVHIDKRAYIGKCIIMHGLGSVALIKLPNGKKVVVGQARNVAFILEDEDLPPQEEGHAPHNGSIS
jgi:hypothetical protein